MGTSMSHCRAGKLVCRIFPTLPCATYLHAVWWDHTARTSNCKTVRPACRIIPTFPRATYFQVAWWGHTACTSNCRAGKLVCSIFPTLPCATYLHAVWWDHTAHTSNCRTVRPACRIFPTFPPASYFHAVQCGPTSNSAVRCACSISPLNHLKVNGGDLACGWKYEQDLPHLPSRSTVGHTARMYTSRAVRHACRIFLTFPRATALQAVQWGHVRLTAEQVYMRAGSSPHFHMPLTFTQYCGDMLHVRLTE